MDFNSTLSILGTIASLIGAWIAIREVKKAKSLKSEIESIKKELNSKLKSKELNDLLSDAKRIRTILINYKLRLDIESDKNASKANLKDIVSEGIDIKSNFMDFNLFVSKLNDNGIVIRKIEGITYDYEELIKNFNEISKDNIFEKVKSILVNLNNFILKLNDDLNAKIFES
jgi:hypothetical protein